MKNERREYLRVWIALSIILALLWGWISRGLGISPFCSVAVGALVALFVFWAACIVWNC